MHALELHAENAQVQVANTIAKNFLISINNQYYCVQFTRGLFCVHLPSLQKSKGSRSKSSNQEQLEEKDERIRHLEAVNITLKQTNDDLNEEVAELRRQLDEQTEKVKLMQQLDV